MSFFKKFGTINYSLDGYNKDAMNILTAAVIKHLNVDKSYVYQTYRVPDGTTPESLAQKLYGDPEKYWAILLVNGIIDPFTDWPMEQQVLEDWVIAKYGNANEILYFTDLNTGRTLDPFKDAQIRALMADDQPIPNNVHPVTALEFENDLNNQKADITVIAARYINLFVDTFNKAIEGKE